MCFSFPRWHLYMGLWSIHMYSICPCLLVLGAALGSITKTLETWRGSKTPVSLSIELFTWSLNWLRLNISVVWDSSLCFFLWILPLLAVRFRLLKHTRLNVVAFLNELPKTQHDIASFNVDVNTFTVRSCLFCQTQLVLVINLILSLGVMYLY